METGHQGKVERVNSTIKQMLTKEILTRVQEAVVEEKDFLEVLIQSGNWVDRLSKVVEVYNNTPKAITGLTPNEVHFGKKAQPSEHFALEEDVELLKEMNAEEVRI
jgi:hypothetical protein